MIVNEHLWKRLGLLGDVEYFQCVKCSERTSFWGRVRYPSCQRRVFSVKITGVVIVK
jgi:galactose-1-phosphate uridylyltransferase